MSHYYKFTMLLLTCYLPFNVSAVLLVDILVISTFPDTMIER